MALDSEEEFAALRSIGPATVRIQCDDSWVDNWRSDEKMKLLRLHRLRIVIGPSCASTTFILLSLIVRSGVRPLLLGMAQNLPKIAQ